MKPDADSPTSFDPRDAGPVNTRIYSVREPLPVNPDLDGCIQRTMMSDMLDGTVMITELYDVSLPQCPFVLLPDGARRKVDIS